MEQVQVMLLLDEPHRSHTLVPRHLRLNKDVDGVRRLCYLPAPLEVHKTHSTLLWPQDIRHPEVAKDKVVLVQQLDCAPDLGVLCGRQRAVVVRIRDAILDHGQQPVPCQRLAAPQPRCKGWVGGREERLGLGTVLEHELDDDGALRARAGVRERCANTAFEGSLGIS